MGDETEIRKRKPGPTFYGIVAFKLLKGTIFFVLAIIVYTLSDNDLPTEYQKLLTFLRIHPGNKFFEGLAVQVGHLTQTKLIVAAVGTFIYSLFSLVEGVGMAFRASWAGWLAIGESAFFIPIEFAELVRSFSIRLGIVLIINLVIVCYLFKNRHRLFRHHLH